MCKVSKDITFFRLNVPFFCVQALEGQKQRVQKLQRQVSQSKIQYSRSLRNLEDISESIHEQRRMRKQHSLQQQDLISMAKSRREPGVGAPSSSSLSASEKQKMLMSPLPSFDLDECDANSDAMLEERAAASGASSSARGSVDFQIEEEEEEEEIDGAKGGRVFQNKVSSGDSSALTRSLSCPAESLGQMLSKAQEYQRQTSRLERQGNLDEEEAADAEDPPPSVDEVAEKCEKLEL